MRGSLTPPLSRTVLWHPPAPSPSCSSTCAILRRSAAPRRTEPKQTHLRLSPTKTPFSLRTLGAFHSIHRLDLLGRLWKTAGIRPVPGARRPGSTPCLPGWDGWETRLSGYRSTASAVRRGQVARPLRLTSLQPPTAVGDDPN
ncbi:hypothetical protein SKAU_G00085360 [Synaphobranchus kaupii]|uniref:Uncharacterized protein n=1 Tax=Synaphobranchus kaupii TaxID=118154 RepID=A0A9Q1J5Z7_SYNKA|nr:hypothetical protein SKAU_G00085360 [Synaphobranchus kaupii]